MNAIKAKTLYQKKIIDYPKWRSDGLTHDSKAKSYFL